MRRFIHAALHDAPVIGALSTMATAVVVALIAFNLPHEEIALRKETGFPVIEKSLPVRSPAAPSAPQPVNAYTMKIPEGFRAVTIDVPGNGAAEGWARPGARTDVQWFGDLKGQRVTERAADNAKVLSVEKMTNPSGTPVNRTTLLVSQQDAQRIAALQQQGSMALNLRGAVDSAGTSAGAITIDSLYSGSAKSGLHDKGGVVTTREKDGSIQQYKISAGGLEIDPIQKAGGDLSNSPALRRLDEEGRSADWNMWPPVGAYYPPYQPPAPINGEHYAVTEENKPTDPAVEPQSTFAVDVDTGSYTNVRRFLQEGNLPPAAAVRTEEFLNYFSYDYPSPVDRPFAAVTEVAPSPLDPGRHLLRIGIKAKDLAPHAGGWNLIFLIDVSGSMNTAEKLPLIKRSLDVLVDQMTPEDRIGIVTYADSGNVLLEPTNGADKYRIHAAINNLQAGGGTNGGAGIDLAYQLAHRSFRQGGVNRVVMATDGDFNAGVYDFNGLMQLIERERQSGVSLTTLGVGTGDINEQNLEQLADKGNGNYFYLDSFDEARRVLRDKLAGTMETVAKDVKIQVEFNKGNVREYRLIGFDNRGLSNVDFHDDRVDAGEIGSGHTVTALYELVLNGSEAALRSSAHRYDVQPVPAPAAPAVLPQELGYVRIRYQAPAGGPSTMLEFPILMKDVKPSAAQASDDFRFAAAVAYFGSVLRQSSYSGGFSLSAVADLAGHAMGQDADGRRHEFVRLVESAAALRGEPLTGAAR